MLQDAQGWLKSITDFGVTLIVAAIVIDILFPNVTGITANIGVIVAKFSEAGLAGFIALLLFAVFWQNKSAGAKA